MKQSFLILILFPTIIIAQISQFPYTQNFDSIYITPPALPTGWSSTQNRSPGTNDFRTDSSSSSRSLPKAVLSTNARINQNLISPLINFTDKLVDTIKFFERRTSTHDSGLLLEASTDGGSDYTIIIGDTLKNPGHTNYFQRKFPLSPTLNNQSTVKFRWRVIGNGTGSTGTIRFDDIYISTKTKIDIGISNISYLPNFPIVGDSILFTVTIKNFGMQPVNNFYINIYIDANFDSVAQSNEFFASVNVDTNLNQFDSIKTSVLIPWMDLSELQIIAQTDIQGDENSLNNSKVTRISFYAKPFSIVVNEIMYKPTAPEPEWIEITNNTSDSINLKNWKISDSKTTTKATITTSNYFLKTGSYAVITKDTTNFYEVRPNTPGKVFIIPTLATFNNDSDAVVIFDQRGSIIDSVFYKSKWGGNDGSSLERIDASINSMDSTNWGSSLDSTGATPGKQNFLTPLDFNLQAVRIYSYQTLPNEPVDVFTVVRNIGRNSADNFSIKLYHDINSDSIPQDTELITTKYISQFLFPKDSITVKFNWNHQGFGQKQLIARVDYLKDMRLIDNIVLGTIRICYPKNSLIINEIMFAPLSDYCEYVELYNREQFPISLKNWKIHDRPDQTGKANEYKLGNSDIILLPGKYIVLASDTTILKQFNYLSDTTQRVKLHIFNKSSLSLNNDGDDVVLKDLTGYVIDSVRYSPRWHNPEIGDVSGRSLERINPNLASNDSRNWSTCTNPIGGTPGKQNSIFASTVPTNTSLSFSPNPFSPDGDGFDDHCLISYNLPSTTAMIRIRIFDSKGRLIRTLVNNEPSGSSGQFIWDGMNDSREKARIGIYVVLLEAFDINGGNVNTVKGVLVLAAKL